MTFTLDFQGQILKMLYPGYGIDMKPMRWVDRMSDSHCDFELWSPDLDLGF